MIFLWEKLVIAKRRHVGKPIRVREIFSVCMAASLERRGFIFLEEGNWKTQKSFPTLRQEIRH